MAPSSLKYTTFAKASGSSCSSNIRLNIIYVQCYFVTIATILGTGILGLPVKLARSGLYPFLISFIFGFFMQVLLIYFFTELLQRCHAKQLQPARDRGPENLPLNDMELEDEIEEEHETNDAVMAGHIIIPKEVEVRPPNLHLLGELFLDRGLRQMFDIVLLTQFIAILISYALAGSEAYATLMGISHVYLIAPFVWILTIVIVLAFRFIQPIVSLLTFGKGSLLLATVMITFFVGASIHHEVTTDFSFTGEPFLMGTVALGGIINVMPFLYSKIQPYDNQIRGYRRSVNLGLVTCTLLNILWCWAVLDIVPQRNSCFLYDPHHNNSLHSVSDSDTASRLVCAHNLSLESAEENGDISTIPLTQIIHQLYPGYDWIATLIELFIMLSITVSFLTMGAALQHTLIGWVESMFGPEKISAYMGRLHVVSRCSFVSSQCICRLSLSVVAFGTVFAISMINPKGFISTLEKAASLLINLEAGCFVFLMIQRATGPQNSYLQIPLPLGRCFSRLKYFIPLYFNFAVIYDLFATIYGLASGEHSLPWESSGRPGILDYPEDQMLNSTRF